MKVLNRKEFLALPSGVLFSNFEPCYFQEIRVKLQTSGNDFIYQDINSAIKCDSSEEFNEKMFEATEKGTELEMDFECAGRDGMFDADQLFAVWNKDDVKSLIKLLESISK